MKLVKKKLDDLKPAPYNPRIDIKTNSSLYKKLEQSIDTFGLVEPIIWNKKTGYVVGGHQRLQILKDKNIKETDVIVVDLKPEQEKSLNIALNKISGEWDDEKLNSLLQELESVDKELSSVTGFDVKEIDYLLDKFSEYDNESFDTNKAIESKSKYKINSGDVFQLGRHRLMCGDSTNRENMKILMNNKIANLVFTDPPYNVNYGSSKNPKHKIRHIKGDKQSRFDWIAFNTNFINNIINYYNGGDVYIWGASGPDGMLQRLLFCELGFHWSATIIWKKQQLILTPANYQRIYEACFYGWFNKSSFNGDRKQIELWEFDRPFNSENHPTMKPIELCLKAIKNSSLKNDIVLDMFGGSGSTLIACEQCHRICYMMEIDPHYCSVIIERWESISGKSHKKL